MRISILRLAGLAVFMAIPALPALSQSAAQAVADANSRAVCGGGALVSAEYLPNGTLRATCRGAGQGVPETGLATGPAAAGLTAALALIVIANDDDAASSTTTTTTTTSGD